MFSLFLTFCQLLAGFIRCSRVGEGTLWRAQRGNNELLPMGAVGLPYTTACSLPLRLRVFMNASPPTSSSSPVATSLSVPSRRRALPAFARPALSCGSAILLGGLLVHLFAPAPAKDSLPVEAGAPSLMVISRSQMMTARLVSLAPRTLRGQFHWNTDVTGRAPVTGEVARQLVDVGAHVEAGDRVLEVSTGAVSRPVPVAEVRQNRAEHEQVSAVRSQSALVGQLSSAQNQLVEAQQRVARAKEKVAATSILVKRLLAGEQIPAAGGAFPAPPRKRPHRKRQSATSIASREQSRAQEAVSSAKNSLDSAQNERDDARKTIADAQKKIASTKAALERVETDFKAEKTTADVLQSARSDADDAASALKTAQARADVADKALGSRQSQVEAAQSFAQKIRTRDQAKPAPTSEDVPDAPDDTPAQQRFLTADQAATMVASAVKESKSATRTADRMRARVANYQHQVSSTSQQREEATKDLQVAQQQVLDTAPRALFSVARAPRSGTITWVSRLAREVSTGQSVFGISEGQSAFLRFEDKGSAWKSLQVGQTLNAAPAPVEPAAPPTDTNSQAVIASPAGPTARGSAPSLGTPQQAVITPALNGATASGTATASATPQATSIGAGVPLFSIRLTRIMPPKAEGEAAQIDAVVLDQSVLSVGASAVQVQLPTDTAAQSSASTGLGASPSRPVVVPASVVLPRDGVDYIAVMSPGAGSDSHSVSDPKTVTLSWRPVQVARQTAFDVELRAGVRDGEQILNQPALLLSQWKPEDKRPLPVLLDASN